MYNTEEINAVIRNRRSIKPEYFSDQKVDKTLLQQVLENANWAPTHAFTEPWRFVVFADESRKKLGEFEAEFYKKKTTPETFVQAKYDKQINRPLKASYVIALIMERQLDGKKVVPELEELAAVSCAVQNMWLTATAYGLAAYWGSGGATFSDDMKSFLGLKEADKCMGFFYLGYTDRAIPAGKRLTAIGEKVRFF